MHSLTRPIFFLACCLALIASSAFAQNGSLKVSSFPDGAAVTVDGVATGKVTPTSINLAVGDHAISIAAGGGWSSETRIVTITTGVSQLSVTLLPITSAGPQGPPGIPGRCHGSDRRDGSNRRDG
jgi:hypothetical protein